MGASGYGLFKFTKAMLEGKSIDVYNYGKMKRDFTYIDDIVEAIVRVQDVIPQADPEWTVENGSPATSSAPYRIYNIGNSSPVELMDYITALEEAMGMEAEKNMMPIQPGDVLETSADTKPLYDLVGFKPQTSVKDGVKKFVGVVQGVLQRLNGYLILSEPQSQGCGFFVPAFYKSVDEPPLWSAPVYFVPNP
ncbi:Uncharacterised protein [Raoultella ornithinolytica]|nr:Uncharacterised protein [Raoultella ornithinolytica]